MFIREKKDKASLLKVTENKHIYRQVKSFSNYQNTSVITNELA